MGSDDPRVRMELQTCVQKQVELVVEHGSIVVEHGSDPMSPFGLGFELEPLPRFYNML